MVGDTWYVLQSKPHKETQVAHQLKQRHIEFCLPLARVNRVNPRSASLRPYFPQYLFAQLDQQAGGWSSIKWLPGLRRLVEIGGQPAVVAEDFILEIQRRVADLRAAEWPFFRGMKQGDPVKIVQGTLAGYEAIFDARLSGTDRVRVLLQWIAHGQGRNIEFRPIPVELKAESIQLIRSRPGH